MSLMPKELQEKLFPGIVLIVAVNNLLMYITSDLMKVVGELPITATYVAM